MASDKVDEPFLMIPVVVVNAMASMRKLTKNHLNIIFYVALKTWGDYRRKRPATARITNKEISEFCNIAPNNISGYLNALLQANILFRNSDTALGVNSQTEQWDEAALDGGRKTKAGTKYLKGEPSNQAASDESKAISDRSGASGDDVISEMGNSHIGDGRDHTGYEKDHMGYGDIRLKPALKEPLHLPREEKIVKMEDRKKSHWKRKVSSANSKVDACRGTKESYSPTTIETAKRLQEVYAEQRGYQPSQGEWPKVLDMVQRLEAEGKTREQMLGCLTYLATKNEWFSNPSHPWQISSIEKRLNWYLANVIAKESPYAKLPQMSFEERIAAANQRSES